MWNPLSALVTAVNSLTNAVQALTAELKRQREDNVSSLVNQLKQPTADVAEALQKSSN